MGRKKKFEVNEETLTQVEEMSARGLTKADIAAVMGVSEQTFFERQRGNPELGEAYARGKASGKNRSGTALLRKVDAGVVDAIKWYEMTRHGMGERTIVRDEVDIMDSEALRERLSALLSGMLPTLATTEEKE